MSDDRPLADRLRPEAWEEIVGQERWLGPGGLVRNALENGRPISMVLWGPPGCGKTTLARAVASSTSAQFVQLSAVLDGVKRLREIVAQAKRDRMHGLSTVLFVDEIHRWNKGQQDALLPHVEGGTIVLIGATTENPSFELNAALRSRVQLVHLEPLTVPQVQELLTRGAALLNVAVDAPVLTLLAEASGGDARRALGDLERCVAVGGSALTPEGASTLLQRSDIRHDRNGEDHYSVLSALIKSMRGSDPQAAVYWLARLLAGGEPARGIARRLVIFASEDIGNADPRALSVAIDAARAVEMVGMPEVRICLAQAVTWLATSPKSNRAYLAINAAMEEVGRTGPLPVPRHLTNAPGAGYRYPHDAPKGIVSQQHLPDRLVDARFYEPSPYGAEKVIAERMAWWARQLEK